MCEPCHYSWNILHTLSPDNCRQQTCKNPHILLVGVASWGKCPPPGHPSYGWYKEVDPGGSMHLFPRQWDFLCFSSHTEITIKHNWYQFHQVFNSHGVGAGGYTCICIYTNINIWLYQYLSAYTYSYPTLRFDTIITALIRYSWSDFRLIFLWHNGWSGTIMVAKEIIKTHYC